MHRATASPARRKFPAIPLSLEFSLSTRMACAEDAVSSQETEYLKALAAATRSELKDSTLLIYAEGYDKPLRFTRMTPATP